MIRTVVTPEKCEISLHIPESFVGKKIEVIAFEIDEATIVTESLKKTMADFWGTISNDTAVELHRVSAESRDGWEDRLNKQF